MGRGWLGRAGLVAGLAVLLIATNSVFVVRETQRAVMLRFGELVWEDIPPGLHFKVPLMHMVRKFDGRILTVDERPQRFLTKEKKFLSVDSYAKWLIYDVGLFYTATNGEELRANQLLSQRINNGLRAQFGDRSMRDVVSGERDELMIELTKQLDAVARRELGVRVLDIRVKRIDLPEDVSDSVFARMRAEREREARDHRATGKEVAEGIRASADREKIVIEAEAYREAQAIRGEGDARATEIYANTYNREPEFYAFTRSLNAYVKVFSQGSDLMLIGPDSEFFNYLKEISSSGRSER